MNYYITCSNSKFKTSDYPVKPEYGRALRLQALLNELQVSSTICTVDELGNQNINDSMIFVFDSRQSDSMGELYSMFSLSKNCSMTLIQSTRETDFLAECSERVFDRIAEKINTLNGLTIQMLINATCNLSSFVGDAIPKQLVNLVVPYSSYIFALSSFMNPLTNRTYHPNRCYKFIMMYNDESVSNQPFIFDSLQRLKDIIGDSKLFLFNGDEDYVELQRNIKTYSTAEFSIILRNNIETATGYIDERIHDSILAGTYPLILTESETNNVNEFNLISSMMVFVYSQTDTQHIQHLRKLHDGYALKLKQQIQALL